MFYVDTKDTAPLHAQLERAIRFAIATERLRVGEQLPTARQLAVDLRVNANTVAKAYEQLERAGLVKTRRGAGTFVSEHAPELVSDRALEAAGRRDRKKQLKELANRFITEAGGQGFSIDDVIEHLESARRMKE
jgi:GntR family transcriptional regulator